MRFVLRPASLLLFAERLMLVAFLALLVWAPLPLGSNRTWAMGALAVCMGGVLLLSWLVVTLRGQSPVQRCLGAWMPLSALTALATLVAAQAWVGLPGMAGQGVGSVDPYHTRYFLVCTLTYLAAFVLVLLLVNSEQRAKYFVFTLIGAALMQALLAIVLLSTQASYTLFFESINHGSQATGTYINRNHLACYLYLGLSLGVGWILGSLTGASSQESQAKARLVALLKFLLSGRMALRLLLVVMVIALVLTRSRMGNGAFLAGLLAVAVMVWWRLPALRRVVTVVVVSLLLVDVIIVGQWVGLERVVQRMEATAMSEGDRRDEETVEARLQPARHTVPMIAQRPWFGYGGGTYNTAFPPFKSGDMLLHLLYFDHAHNDYAEIAADVGLVGALLLAAVALSTSVRVWTLATLRNTSATRAAAYGVWMALCCVAIHSWVDFNLQIPANALTFTAILALAWAAPWQRQRTRLALR
jgi:O-antigen ligase